MRLRQRAFQERHQSGARMPIRPAGRRKRHRPQAEADRGCRLIGLPTRANRPSWRASQAKPKIADYPFTTLNPQLGVVRIDSTDFVLADSGLTKARMKASPGRQFLGHGEPAMRS